MPRKRRPSPPEVPDLIQAKYAGDPWPVLLCGLLAQQTRGAAAGQVVAEIVDRWPTWQDAHRSLKPHIEQGGHVDTADDVAWRWLFDRLAPLGLQNRRIGAILRWLIVFNGKGLPRTRADVLSLPGCGEYVADGFALFVERDFSEPPRSGDDPLTRYWAAAKEHK